MTKWEIQKQKKSGWINIFVDNTHINGKKPGTCIFKSKEEAIGSYGGNGYYVDTIKIEWEE